MPVCDGNEFVEDEDGRELPDDATAQREAVAAARDMMAGDLRDGFLNLTSFIEVEDDAHNLLFTVRFAEVVTVAGPARRSTRRSRG